MNILHFVNICDYLNIIYVLGRWIPTAWHTAVSGGINSCLEPHCVVFLPNNHQPYYRTQSQSD